MNKDLGWGLLIPLLIVTDAATASENVAKGKTVIGFGNYHASLTDGVHGTTFAPGASYFPYYYVDLGGVYNLSTFRLYCQNQPRFGQQGLNEPFDIHTYDYFINPCEYDLRYPWHPVVYNLTCKKKGQMIEIHPQQLVRFIIIGHPNDKYPNPAQPVLMGEVEAYGEKVADAPEFQLPVDNNPIPENYYMATRQKIIGEQKYIWTSPGIGYLVQNEEHKDVALAWTEKPLVIAAIRQDARLLVGVGDLVPKEIADRSWPAKLRVTAGAWLTKGSGTVKFSKVTGPYQSGDILLILSTDQFDVETVYTKLITGENSAVIGCGREGPNNSTIQLIQKLNIEFVRRELPIKDEVVYVTNTLKSPRYTPPSYILDRYMNSWNAMTTEDLLDSDVLGWEEDRAQRKMKEFIDKYEKVMQFLGPCDMNRYKKDTATYKALQNYNKILKHQHEDTCRVLPYIHLAPGDVKPGAKPTNVVANIYADLPSAYFPVGLYAKPGEAIRWTVLEDSDWSLTKQFIRINAQVDSITIHDEWRRWPFVGSWYPLTKQGQICSPHGGPIFLQLEQGINITIKFENGYRYPWLDMRNKKSIKTFEQEMKEYNSAPWMVVNGDSMGNQLMMNHVLMSNSSAIISSVRHFDDSVKLMCNYRGTEWEKRKLEMFCSDVQILRGYGHAGYPMMGHLKWSLDFAKFTEIKSGELEGYIHEIGHNLQVSEATLRRGGEVTNNVYRTVVRHYLLDVDTYGNDRDTETWNSDTYIGPEWGYYKYLMSMFGDGVVGNGFIEAIRAKPKDENEKTQFWLKQMCNETGYDLLPFHSLWKFPVSEETTEFCGRYPCFFPDDKWTQGAQEKVDKILKAYGKTCIRSNPKQVVFRGDLMRGLGTVRPQNIFLKFQ